VKEKSYGRLLGVGANRFTKLCLHATNITQTFRPPIPQSQSQVLVPKQMLVLKQMLVMKKILVMNSFGWLILDQNR